MPRLLASMTITDSEFDKKATRFRTVLSNQYLYPIINLSEGKPKSFFGRSLLSPDSNGILLLFPCHPSSWTNNGCGPPSPGRGTSTCTGIDHLVSGLTFVTQALFILNPSQQVLRVFAFAAASPRRGLTLPQPSTPSVVFQDERQDTEHYYSFQQFPIFTSRSFNSSVPCPPMAV